LYNEDVFIILSSKKKRRVAVGTEIKKAVQAVDENAQYDEQAKKLLGHKIILAYILVNTVDEFKGMNPKEVVNYIEGEPYINKIPVDSGLTNVTKEVNGEKIVGFNTENAEMNEGMIRFDIVFYVRMKDGLAQIIVNVESQKDEPTAYHVINRAVFYVSRLISSQKGRDFANTNYNDIKTTYSIWVCMNLSENCMNHIHLVNDSLLGSYAWKGNLELLNIVMIGLSDEIPEHEEKYELHRLLCTMFSDKISVKQKLDVMEHEYQISMENNMESEVSKMSNLGQGIAERAEARAETKMIMNMYNNNYTVEQISVITEKSISEVEEIINKNKKEPVMA
jgi:hypothetical protein